MSVELKFDGPGSAAGTVALAHGAGAPMDSPFMERFASGLAARGLRVVRFEFPYMHRRRIEGRRRPPDRLPVLQETWLEVIERLGERHRLTIGGKSMGGRIASTIADESEVAGLVCLGYPFHPPDKPERLRTAHLEDLRTPTLIVQGERDRLGRREEVASYRLAPGVRVEFLTDGDHSFKPRVRSGHTLDGHLDLAIRLVAEFVESSCR